ncbi:MAG: hypothetical protein NUW01_07140 [Gemmatimonadaceae bacterium]|nr:hypothetical protein [Gemmatimonadaceae bacterium]
MIIEQVDSPMFRTDDGNIVQFYWASDKNGVESEKAGRAVHDKVLRGRILAPGVRQLAVPVFEIERHLANGTVKIARHHAERYAKQLEAFKAKSASPELTGTPLTSWPALDVAQIANLKSLNVHVVEALAELSDQNLVHFPPGTRALREKAKVFLEAAKGNAPIEKLAKENDDLKEQIAALMQNVADLAARIPAPAETAEPQIDPAQEKRGPGRPRKAA